jgi:hypothetical protein
MTNLSGYHTEQFSESARGVADLLLHEQRVVTPSQMSQVGVAQAVQTDLGGGDRPAWRWER